MGFVSLRTSEGGWADVIAEVQCNKSSISSSPFPHNGIRSVESAERNYGHQKFFSLRRKVDALRM